MVSLETLETKLSQCEQALKKTKSKYCRNDLMKYKRKLIKEIRKYENQQFRARKHQTH